MENGEKIWVNKMILIMLNQKDYVMIIIHNKFAEFNTLPFVIDSKNGFHWLSQKFKLKQYYNLEVIKDILTQ